MKAIIKIVCSIVLACSAFVSFGQSNVPDEVYELADSIETTISELDGSYLDEHFDKEKFLAKFLQEAKGNDKILRFNSGFIRGMLEKYSIANPVVSHIEQGYYYNYIHAYAGEKGIYYLIFRLLSDDGALTYHKMKVSKTDHEFMIEDIYYYGGGEWQSKTMKRMYISSLVELLNGEKGEYSKALIKSVEIKELMRNEKFDDAYKLFKTIPESVQNDKAFKLMEVEITSNISEELYSKVLKSYHKLFPNDPSLNLNLIDHYSIQKKYKKVLACIDRLEEQVYGDEMLDFLRGDVYHNMKNYDKAESYFKSVFQNFPYFPSAVTQLILVLESQGKFDEALPYLDYYHETLECDYKDIFPWVEETYPSLAKSESYRTWEVSRQEKKNN